MTTEAVLSTLPDVYSVSVDTFCLQDRITTLQDGVTKLQRCLVEIKMKAEFEDGG